MPLIDLVSQSGNDEVILSLWLVSVSTDNCRHTFTTKNGMVPRCIICFKQSHHNLRHCDKNMTALSQNTVAQRSDFEMLLTNGLQQWRGPPDKQKGSMG